MMLLPGYYRNEIFSRRVMIQLLAPGETFYWRVPLVLPGQAPKIGILNDKGYRELELKIKTVEISSNSPKALQIFLISSLLLPPWSNGLIPALVLFACYLAEGFIRESPSEKKAFLLLFLYSFLVLLFFFVLLGFIVNIREFLMWASILMILLSVIIVFPGVKNFLFKLLGKYVQRARND